MSNNIAIHVENLGKLYHIGKARQRHDTLRDALGAMFRRGGDRKAEEEIWALKDVSFEIKRGEVVGVIGRNGAGKSTLLKILSRITEPTSGRAEIHGRVGSLLEVGTGFHPELTGRENIYLSGAILGMRRAEIDRKFDEIVDFSGVEKFIDTPFKRYSSGMRVRLGFAVAAHLDPEILLVDEVLAVGDAEFQQKCLGKMGEVAGEGRTVLFVSHNMGAIASLCSRCVLLEDGYVEEDDITEKVVYSYLQQSANLLEIPLAQRQDRDGNGVAKFVDVKLSKTYSGPAISEFFIGDDIYFSLIVEAEESVRLWIGVDIADVFGNKVMSSSTRLHGLSPICIERGSRVVWHIPHCMLGEGLYYVALSMVVAETLERADYLSSAMTFQVLPKDIYKSGFPVTQYFGTIHLPNEWIVNGI
jgi:lipopolysaccharide transport system ATP-binding protein